MKRLLACLVLCASLSASAQDDNCTVLGIQELTQLVLEMQNDLDTCSLHVSGPTTWNTPYQVGLEDLCSFMLISSDGSQTIVLPEGAPFGTEINMVCINNNFGVGIKELNGSGAYLSYELWNSLLRAIVLLGGAQFDAEAFVGFHIVE